jgi:hypothetical protein
LENKDTLWWDAVSAFTNDLDGKLLAKAFSPEQYRILCAMFKKLDAALEWHDSEENENAHPLLLKKVDNLDAKLRNHRHETGKTFSAKPES